MNALFKKFITRLIRWQAGYVLAKHKPRIIGITGSVGKTTVKDAVATLLGEHERVWKSPKSYNSELGIPLAILGLESAWQSPLGWIQNIIKGAMLMVSKKMYPKYIVLEMGVDRPGDFEKILSWIKPHGGVVTAIGDVPVHVEFFVNPGAIAAEKGKLVERIQEDGYVVLNRDDAGVYAMRNRAPGRVVSYGFHPEAEVQASMYKLLIRNGLPYGMTFKLSHGGKIVPVKIEGIVGKQNVSALLAAAAVGVAEGLNLIEISEGLGKFKLPPGRFSLIEGIHKTLIIDSSYNASPLAVESALEIFGEITGHRKVVMLGDMLELGKFTPEEHRKIGRIAANVADVVVAVGIRAKVLEEAKPKEFYWFRNSYEAADRIMMFVKEGDVILVKGSQGVRMEIIVEALMKNPEHANALLVRQEPYWKTR